jgi:signal transduction histidine kinase
MAMPVISTETGEAIAAVVLGFRAGDRPSAGAAEGVLGGIWAEGRLDLPGVPQEARDTLERRIAGLAGRAERGRVDGALLGGRFLAFYWRIGRGSRYPAAYELAVYPLAELSARQRTLAWEFGGAWALVVAGAFGASRFLSGRLSAPVERLEVDSLENRRMRQRAEEALEFKSRELQRSERFSADASHQLKTPVTVLRAGLEELLAGDQLGSDARREVSGLVHQTYRLGGVIDDLLLLSRMDAGRLQIQFGALDLSHLVDSLVDDLGALPDPGAPEVLAEVDRGLWVAGERRYAALILENLLENARKYNRPGGRISVRALREGGDVRVAVGNTGAPIPEASRAHIFERFHRGAVGENVPGHGIGLNLARELARLHGGEILLVRSDGEWTEFELRLRAAPAPGEAPR